jgi:hypothetical protein
VAEATGAAESSQAPMRVHPVHRANLALLQRKGRSANAPNDLPLAGEGRGGGKTQTARRRRA